MNFKYKIHRYNYTNKSKENISTTAFRASDRSRKKKSNFAGFLGTNSLKNRLILQKIVGVFGANFTKKQSVKNS